MVLSPERSHEDWTINGENTKFSVSELWGRTTSLGEEQRWAAIKLQPIFGDA